MATKKHSQPTSADKTTKARQTKVAKDDAPPPEIPSQSEALPVEAAEGTKAPTLQTTTADTPLATEVQPLEPEQTPVDACGKGKKLSALDAAARVLGESGQAMNCQELITAMAAKGYWSSPHGKTPAGTLYSAILREVQTKKEQARFRKSQRGKFELRREG